MAQVSISYIGMVVEHFVLQFIIASNFCTVNKSLFQNLKTFNQSTMIILYIY